MLEREVRETGRKAETLQWERTSVETRHADAAEKLHSLESELANSGTNLGDLQARLSELQAELETLRGNEAEASAELNELRIKVATEKQRQNSLNNQRQPMEARLTELGELITQRHRDIESYASKSRDLAAESGRIQSEIEVARGRAAEADERVQTLVERARCGHCLSRFAGSHAAHHAAAVERVPRPARPAGGETNAGSSPH